MSIVKVDVIETLDSSMSASVAELIARMGGPASKLETPVLINGKSFDGSEDLTLVIADIPDARAVLEKPSASALTYDGQGRLATITDTVNSVPRVTTLTYNPDGTLQKTVEVKGNRTRTEILTYSSGTLSSIAITEVIS